MNPHQPSSSCASHIGCLAVGRVRPAVDLQPNYRDGWAPRPKPYTPPDTGHGGSRRFGLKWFGGRVATLQMSLSLAMNLSCVGDVLVVLVVVGRVQLGPGSRCPVPRFAIAQSGASASRVRRDCVCSLSAADRASALATEQHSGPTARAPARYRRNRPRLTAAIVGTRKLSHPGGRDPRGAEPLGGGSVGSRSRTDRMQSLATNEEV
jgi:hypothetical protein